jgi:hypothetical protein
MVDSKRFRNWEDFKPLIKKRWDKLSDSQIDQTQGDKKNLIQLIRNHYSDETPVIEQELENMNNQILKKRGYS